MIPTGNGGIPGEDLALAGSFTVNEAYTQRSRDSLNRVTGKWRDKKNYRNRERSLATLFALPDPAV